MGLNNDHGATLIWLPEIYDIIFHTHDMRLRVAYLHIILNKFITLI